jgi:hypothetical protein
VRWRDATRSSPTGKAAAHTGEQRFDLFGDGGFAADDGSIRRSCGAADVEDAAVVGQRAVVGEALCRRSPSLRDIVVHGDRKARDDPRRWSARA